MAYRYESIDEAGPDIRIDYLTFDGQHNEARKALVAKYNPLVMTGVKKGQMIRWLDQSGLRKAKLEIEAKRRQEFTTASMIVKAEARRAAEKQREKLTAVAVEELSKNERKAQAKHSERISKLHDRAFEKIDSVEPNEKNLKGYLEQIDQWDKIGRRIFNMDKAEPMSPHQRNIAMLVKADTLVVSQEGATPGGTG